MDKEDFVLERFKKRIDARGYRCILSDISGVSKVKYPKQARSAVACIDCNRQVSSKHLKEHLKQHKWSEKKIITFCASVYQKNRKGNATECPACKKIIVDLRHHRRRCQANQEFESASTEIENSENIDPVDELINNELNTKYGSTNSFRTGDHFIKSEADARKEKLLLNSLLTYYTSAHSKGKDPASVQVKQHLCNLKGRLNKLAVILGRFPEPFEIMDAKLFLNKELDGNLKASSKSKYASDFISLGEAIIWNKKTFCGSERADIFDTLSIENIRDAQTEIRRAKTRFYAESSGHEANAQFEKTRQMAAEEDLKLIWSKTKELILCDGGSDDKSFRKQRDHMLTCLAAFQPIRLLPLEDMTVGAVVNPVEKKEKEFVTIKISGFKHQGRHKTFRKYGSPIINVSWELYDLLLRFIENLRRVIPTSSDDLQPMFCKMNGEALEGIGNIIMKTAEKICSRKITATGFRRAKTTLGRRAGIDAKQLSRAMLHSTDVADKYYDVDVLNNPSSLKYFNFITQSPASTTGGTSANDIIVSSAAGAATNDSAFSAAAAVTNDNTFSAAAAATTDSSFSAAGTSANASGFSAAETAKGSKVLDGVGLTTEVPPLRQPIGLDFPPVLRRSRRKAAKINFHDYCL